MISFQAVKFHLTNLSIPFSWPRISEIPDMKKTLLLSTVVSFAMICSCQKNDSGAEAQLAQRKTELDAREEALIQREKAVDAREKEIAEREKALANSRIIQSQRQAPDAAQAEAERQKRIQQLPPELKALVPDRSQVEAARAQKQQQSAQRQSEIQQSQRMQNARQRKLDAMQKWQTSGAALSPGAQSSSPTASPAIETQSETESPTP